MTVLAVSVVCIGGISGLMVVLLLLGRSARRHGTAGPAIGAAMAAYDQAMHATAYDTFMEMQAQEERTIPLVAATDS